MYITKNIVLILTLCIIQFKSNDGCSCYIPHPQTDYCSSDFALAVVPLSHKLDDNKIEIAVDINEIYKENNTSKSGIITKKIYTAEISSLCGVNLELNQTWLITGKSINDRNYIHLCQFIRPLEGVSLFQREGFKSLYEKGCSCKIDEFHMVYSKKICNVEKSEYTHCYSSHSACVPNDDGVCQWIENQDFTNCKNQAK